MQSCLLKLAAIRGPVGLDLPCLVDYCPEGAKGMKSPRARALRSCPSSSATCHFGYQTALPNRSIHTSRIESCCISKLQAPNNHHCSCIATAKARDFCGWDRLAPADGQADRSATSTMPAVVGQIRNDPTVGGARPRGWKVKRTRRRRLPPPRARPPGPFATNRARAARNNPGSAARAEH